jgi:hypothetical protein
LFRTLPQCVQATVFRRKILPLWKYPNRWQVNFQGLLDRMGTMASPRPAPISPGPETLAAGAFANGTGMARAVGTSQG